MKTENTEQTEIDDSIATETPALVLRSPSVPVTLDQLAAMPASAVEIAEARVRVLKTLQGHSLNLTHESDWLLFKAKDEDITHAHGYLADCGCERIRSLWGISIFNISTPEKIAGPDGSFIYIIKGDGKSGVTGQTVEGVEGGRSSTDDICKDVYGAELELLVRKSARANLDGNLVRELTGTSSMPVSALLRAWQGTGKSIDNCRLGRGFGSRSERLGAAPDNAPDVPPPVCAICGTTGVYRPAKDNRAAFFGCPKFNTHKDQKWIVNAKDWVRQQQQKEAAPNA